MEIFDNQVQYAAFRKKQLELSGMLKEASDVISSLNMNQYRDNLKALSAKVHNDTFKIQVVGTFKNGKSTFINSILGENVLPAYSVPCTAIINEVKYGEKKRAVLYFNNPLPEQLPKEISQKALSHMKKYNMKNVPPLEIPYNEIEDYAVIPIGKDAKEALLESPYEKIELFWPLELLKNGVEIIDSPGLNENGIRTKVTMDYLTKADAILFVLNATSLCAADEMNFIEHNLKSQGFEDPFFIVNRFDLIADRERDPARKERERAMIRQYAHNKLDTYTTNEIYFVSAINALDGKLDSDEKMYKSSGMSELETALSDYLTEQKGKVKLVQPSKELKRILNYEAKDKIIPMQRKMLTQQVDEIKKRYEAAKPQLERLNVEKNQVHSQLMLRIEQSKPEIKRAITSQMNNIKDSITAWINDYEPEAKLGLVNKEKAAEVTEEIQNYVNEKIAENQLQWQQEILIPLINEKASYIFESVETDLTKIHHEIDEVNVELSSGEYSTNNVPTWQRVVGVVGGLAIGDVGLAFSGGVNGLGKDFAKTAALEAGGGIVLGLLGILNPVTLGALVIGAFLFNLKKGKSNAMCKLKEQIIQSYIQQLSNFSDTKPDEIANSVVTELTGLAEKVVQSLDIEINETENQVKGIIAELEKGKENAAKREKFIAASEEKINDLSKRLDNLIFRLVEE